MFRTQTQCYPFSTSCTVDSPRHHTLHINWVIPILSYYLWVRPVWRWSCANRTSCMHITQDRSDQCFYTIYTLPQWPWRASAKNSRQSTRARNATNDIVRSFCAAVSDVFACSKYSLHNYKYKYIYVAVVDFCRFVTSVLFKGQYTRNDYQWLSHLLTMICVNSVTTTGYTVRRFSTMHWTDRQTDRPTDRRRSRESLTTIGRCTPIATRPKMLT